MNHSDTDAIHPPLSRGGMDDIVIVGGGLAGLFCALRLAPRPVTVLAAAPVGEGAASAWAQGGIAAALSPGDSIEAHLADTIAVGGEIVDARAAEIMVREASARVHDLLAYGVPFDRDLEGHLEMSREAAHSAARVVRVGGDQAGAAIMAALGAAVRATPSIRLIERATGKSLALDECGRVAGIVARVGIHRTRVLFPARAIVLATGGAGHLFAVTTNPSEAEGSGIAMAARAGAVIADAEFVQFHPTALAIGRDPAPLVTEAIRGAGAILIDDRGERFMEGVHALAELAPRDIVARAIHRQIARGRRVFLDARKSIGAAFSAEFPTVEGFCRAAGIDPALEPIPVAPAAHYHMGGVLVDANGRSSLDGLWVCGEAASTGAHGANRLASNSLLEAVVFAARIADDLRSLRPRLQPATIAPSIDLPAAKGRPDARAMGVLRRLMTDKVGVVRDGEGLAGALAAISELERRPSAAHLRNPLIAAKLIAAAAYARTETRGAHARTDFPAADPVQGHRSFITLDAANRLAESVADRAPPGKRLATVA